MVRSKTNMMSGAFTLAVLGGAAIVLLSLAPRFLTKAAATEPGVAVRSAQYTTFTNDRYGYSVSYPQGWRVGEGSIETNVATLTAPLQNATPGTGGRVAENHDRNLAKVDIVVFEVADDTSVTDFIRQRTDTPLEGELVPTRLSDLTAMKVSVPVDESVYNYVTYFAVKGNYGYIVAGLASTDTLAHIAESFNVK